MKRRRYSDEDRAGALAALAANGGNLDRTSEQLGIPEPTLRHWRDGNRHPEAREQARGKQQELADKMEELAGKLLAGITPEAIRDADLRQTAVALGIAIDKLLLLRGQPTAITKAHHSLADLADEDLHTEIARLEETLKRGGNGTTH